MKLSRRVLKGKADGSSGGEIEASTFELYSFHFYLARARARLPGLVTVITVAVAVRVVALPIWASGFI